MPTPSPFLPRMHFALALFFLGADAAADGGQGVGGLDYLICGARSRPRRPGDKLGDADLYGAAGAAGGIGAVHAALCLVNGHLGGVAQGDLVKVLLRTLGSCSGMGFLSFLILTIALASVILQICWFISASSSRIEGAALEKQIEIHPWASKSGPSTQANFGLAADGNAAAAAHTCAVNHDGIEETMVFTP